MIVEPQPRPAHLQIPGLRRMMTSLLFYPQWLFVIGVSVFDNLLTIQFHDQMIDSELNPMGQALLQLNSGGVAYFVAAKGIGTILAATIALLLYWHRPWNGLAVIAGLTIFQFGLLLFLTLK